MFNYNPVSQSIIFLFAKMPILLSRLTSFFKNGKNMLKNMIFLTLKKNFSLWNIKAHGFRRGYYILTQCVLNLFLNPLVKLLNDFEKFFVKFTYEKYAYN